MYLIGTVAVPPRVNVSRHVQGLQQSILSTSLSRTVRPSAKESARNLRNLLAKLAKLFDVRSAGSARSAPVQKKNNRKLLPEIHATSFISTTSELDVRTTTTNLAWPCFEHFDDVDDVDDVDDNADSDSDVKHVNGGGDAIVKLLTITNRNSAKRVPLLHPSSTLVCHDWLQGDPVVQHQRMGSRLSSGQVEQGAGSQIGHSASVDLAN